MGNFANPDNKGDLPLPDGRVSIDAEELADLRFQASQFIPYKEESYRLALALQSANPHHPLLRGEMWVAYFHTKAQREREGLGVSPSPMPLDPDDAAAIRGRTLGSDRV